MARSPELEPGIGLGELLERARALVVTLERLEGDRARLTSARLEDSVVRPLGTVVEVSEQTTTRDDALPESGEGLAGRVAERIWQLAKLASAARAQVGRRRPG